MDASKWSWKHDDAGGGEPGFEGEAPPASSGRRGRRRCTPEAIELELELFRLRGDWQIERKKGEISASTVRLTGLLRDLSARTLAQVAHGGLLSPSVIWSHERLHRELLQTDNRYVSTAAQLAVAALRSCHRSASAPPSDFPP
jgi:hypothetical protein